MLRFQDLPSVTDIHERLQQIFPEGAPSRNYCTREIAARTIFVMLYVGAVAGSNRWLRPDQVTRMTDRQASRHSNHDRLAWSEESCRPSKGEISGRWYAANTREPIRDETLRDGLIPAGAVTVREGLPTTSAKPRYALTDEFAALFDPNVTGKAFDQRVADWQAANLSAGALARIQIMKRGAVASRRDIMVSFPSGETRRLAPGPSSIISKAVIEEFAPRFLEAPAVIWLSESGNKVVARDDDLARSIGLQILPDRNLPDMILADLGPSEPTLVFVEVVATDGPITERRKQVLLTLATEAGFAAEHVAFVTAFLDRSTSAFRKALPALAWRSLAWFASEPDHVMLFRDGGQRRQTRLDQILLSVFPHA